MARVSERLPRRVSHQGGRRADRGRRGAYRWLGVGGGAEHGRRRPAVTPMWVWRRSSLMTARSTPCSRSRVAVDCRRSWKRMRRNPARWRRPRKRRVRLAGSRGPPAGVVKMRPSSFQPVPETVRSLSRAPDGSSMTGRTQWAWDAAFGGSGLGGRAVRPPVRVRWRERRMLAVPASRYSMPFLRRALSPGHLTTHRRRAPRRQEQPRAGLLPLPGPQVGDRARVVGARWEFEAGLDAAVGGGAAWGGWRLGIAGPGQVISVQGP